MIPANFVRYQSIENHYRDKFLSSVRAVPRHTEVQWVATEKVHGCNMSFIVSRRKDNNGNNSSQSKKDAVPHSHEQDGLIVNLAQRGGLCGPGFHTNACKAVFDKYKESAVSIFHEVERILKEQGKTAPLEQCTIFGELFGGCYEASTVTSANRRGKPIQEGVYYAPHFEFFAFDVHYTLEKEQEEDYKAYIPYASSVELFARTGFHVHARPLHVGTLEELLEYDVEFPSTVHTLWELPALDDNIAEGIVIKPYDEELYSNDGERCIIKKKSKRFLEIENDQKKGSKPQQQPATKKKSEFENEKTSTLLDECLKYVNRNRLVSVMSKHNDQVTSSKTMQYATELQQDAVEELRKEIADWDAELEAVGKKDKNALLKQLREKCIQVTREWLSTTLTAQSNSA